MNRPGLELDSKGRWDTVLEGEGYPGVEENPMHRKVRRPSAGRPQRHHSDSETEIFITDLPTAFGVKPVSGYFNKKRSGPLLVFAIYTFKRTYLLKRIPNNQKTRYAFAVVLLVRPRRTDTDNTPKKWV